MLLNADFAKLASLTKNLGKTQIFLEQSTFCKRKWSGGSGNNEVVKQFDIDHCQCLL